MHRSERAGKCCTRQWRDSEGCFGTESEVQVYEGGLCRILNPIWALKALHRAAWSCVCNLAGTALSSPIEQAEALHG